MKQFFLHFLLAILVIEVIGNLLGLTGIEPTGHKLIVNGEAFDSHNGYADRDSVVGVWHRPNDVWVQNGPCFTTEMRSNRYGARDNQWDTAKAGNLFLGSSFIEGFGVDYGKRFSETYEQLTGKGVFNCGMAGDFSPVQYYLTMRKFDPILRIDTAFVFFVLPTDDSLTKTIDNKRFRPYLTDTGIAYTRSSAKYPELRGTSQKLSAFFYQYSYSYHLYSYFKSRNYQKSSILFGKKSKPQDYPEVRKMIDRFCIDFPDRFFYFVFIPTLTETPAPAEIRQHANMRVIDLTRSLNRKSDYLVCNSHWNEHGHQRLAKALQKAVSSGK